MKAIVTTSLHEVRAKEESEQAKDAQLQALGFTLAEEKIKNAEREALINSLGQELVATKFELAEIKSELAKLKGEDNQ